MYDLGNIYKDTKVVSSNRLRYNLSLKHLQYLFNTVVVIVALYVGLYRFLAI